MTKQTRWVWAGQCLVALAMASCKPSGSPEPVDSGEPQDSAEPALELLAGATGGSGSGDGTRAAARFDFPSGVAVDTAGIVYVADQRNHSIRRIDRDGVVTTLAGAAGMPGSEDGTGPEARFKFPTGVAVDLGGNVYVADRGNYTIRKITAAGRVTTLAGEPGVPGSNDGTGAGAHFGSPTGVAVDASGNAYVADTASSPVRQITAAGVVTTVASVGSLMSPTGIAVDATGNVYVTARTDCKVYRIDPARVPTLLAGSLCGATDGPGATARFNMPTALAVDSAGGVYVADMANHALRKVTAAGDVTTLAGTARAFGRADGTGVAARFRFPAGIAVDATGTLYVADQVNHTIRKVTAAGDVTTLAGAAGAAGSADGTRAAARFGAPAGAVADSAGNVYVADRYNHTVRKVTPGGVVTTLAGRAGMPGGTDGTGSAARFTMPSGLAIDAAGNLYVADQGNAAIRKITPAGDVTTLTGAASFQLPTAIAVDGAGNLYVADPSSATISKVTTAGGVTILAGTTGSKGSTDGTGTAARFTSPVGMAVDAAGNLYVADQHAIRKVTAAGVVTTLAGKVDVAGRNDGAGTAARFDVPTGIALDAAGNVYVADQFNSTIRKITPDGTTTTLIGTPGAAGILLGTAPRLAYPQALAIVGDSLVIGDSQAVLVLRHGIR